MSIGKTADSGRGCDATIAKPLIKQGGHQLNGGNGHADA
jgi:hypothetical protein